MLEGLLDHSLTIYSILIFAIWIFLILWWRSRKFGLLLGAAAGILLTALFTVLFTLYPTSRTRIKNTLEDMAAGVKANDADRIFRGISGDFQYLGMDRAAFRGFVEARLRQRDVTELVVWDLEWPEGGTERTRPVTFKAKPKGPWDNGSYFLVRGTFVLEKDETWRLQGFRISNPFVDSNLEIKPPGTR